MAIRLTGGVDLEGLAFWCAEALARGESHGEVFVNPRGWFFRVPGQPDFVIEPDAEPMSGDLS
jgi:hypothetical protein